MTAELHVTVILLSLKGIGIQISYVHLHVFYTLLKTMLHESGHVFIVSMCCPHEIHCMAFISTHFFV